MKNFVCSYIKYLKYALGWYSPYTHSQTHTAPTKTQPQLSVVVFVSAVFAEVQQPQQQCQQRGRCAGYIFIFSWFLFDFFFAATLIGCRRVESVGKRVFG